MMPVDLRVWVFVIERGCQVRQLVNGNIHYVDIAGT